MSNILATVFALASLSASVPVAWFFRDLNVPDNSFGQYLWLAMPVLAAILSGLAAALISRFTAPAGFGFWRGALAAVVALVGCAAIAHPVLVLPALVFVGWLVALLGGGFGWLIGRKMGPNNSFKPKPLRGSA